MATDRTPLLEGLDTSYEHRDLHWESDPHAQFCMLVGVPPSQPSRANKSYFNFWPRVSPRTSLYGRVTRKLADQRFIFYLTSSVLNMLLLSQVVMGATLTAMGASESSHTLITVFGAVNTIIAGLVAYMKSRGQPMRARMYLEDLYRVVGEIENSEVMWLGVSHGANGYDEISADGHVTVRSEVARLNRLYNSAVNSNSTNNPDMYILGSYDFSNGASQAKPQQPQPRQVLPLPAAAAPPLPAAALPIQSVGPVAVPAHLPAVAVGPDAEPATAASLPVSPLPKHELKKEENADDSKNGDNMKNDGPSSAPEPDTSRDDANPDNTMMADPFTASPEFPFVDNQNQPFFLPPPLDLDASTANDFQAPLRSDIKLFRPKYGEA